VGRPENRASRTTEGPTFTPTAHSESCLTFCRATMLGMAAGPAVDPLLSMSDPQSQPAPV
jgi:hypothetical protein